MRIILTVVGVTLAIVIVAVAGVYGWMMVSTPPPSDKLPTPPPNVARSAPPVRPPASAYTSASDASSSERVSQTPNAVAPPSSRDIVHPAAPPPTQVADPLSGMPSQIPVAEPDAPVTPESESPQGESAVVPDTMQGKLNALQLGLTDGEVSAIMGEDGSPAEDAGEYLPQGWYALRWRDPDGASITATFDEYNTLVHLTPFKVPGAFEWMNANVPYSVVTWLNDKLESSNLPVRVPAAQIGAVSDTRFQFQAGLVARNGQVMGSIAGTYYIGDGASTYIPGDTRPYVHAIEGSYQFYAPNGAQVADTFGLAEY